MSYLPYSLQNTYIYYFIRYQFQGSKMFSNQTFNTYNNDSSMITQVKMDNWNILRAIFYPLVISLHVLNNFIITRYKVLHKPKYCLLVNLSICDISVYDQCNSGASIASENRSDISI